MLPEARSGSRCRARSFSTPRSSPTWASGSGRSTNGGSSAGRGSRRRNSFSDSRIPFLLADHCIRHAGRLSLFGAEKDYAQELLQVLRRSPAPASAPGRGPARSSGCTAASGVHFWLAPQARLPAREEPAAVGRGACADAGAARLFPGRRQIAPSPRDPAWRAEPLTPHACRNRGGERRGFSRSRSDAIAALAAILASRVSRERSPLARAVGRARSA